MKKTLLVAVAVALLTTGMASAGPSPSIGLKISPLRYDAALAAGEKKQGFVDITNPSAASADIKLFVQAFRQTNDQGGLEFYDDTTIANGVKLDYSDVALGAHETLHLAFLIDGSQLRTGDNFAAIFASTVPDTAAPGQQAVKVGTLLLISNGTPSAHDAVIENLSGSVVQLGNSLDMTFSVHNTASSEAATGFSPQITVKAWPYIDETVAGPLVFAGRTRTINYTKQGNYLGILAVKVSTGSSEQTRYSLLITGYWRIVLPIFLALVSVGVWFLVKHRRHLKKNRG